MLYDNFYKALVLYATKLTGDRECAEDIVQETFTRLWQKRPVFSSIAQVKVYLYTATHNFCISQLRTQGRQASVVSMHSIGAEVFKLTESGDEDFFTPEVYRKLMLMIEALPQRQREVFLLAMQGKKNAEIAETLNISQNTVKVLKGRALQTLKANASSETFFVLFCMLFAE